MYRVLAFLAFFFSGKILFANNWLDSLDNFARERLSPPLTYIQSWVNAPLMYAMAFQYEQAGVGEGDVYLNYVRVATDKNLPFLNGRLPNDVASGFGAAFMFKMTRDDRYLQAANRVYNQMSNIRRTAKGGIVHLPWSVELWDDTIYMIGIFLLEMYKATGEEKYLLELIDQIRIHEEELKVDEWGLWVHGWTETKRFVFDFCSQNNWFDRETGRSAEIWGRGNGWVVVTLSEILNAIDPGHPVWDYVAASLKSKIERLPELQDTRTGHWYQLPVRKAEPGNYIESSATAMFGYGILTALKYGIVEGPVFEQAMGRAYYGLQQFSVRTVENNDRPYLNTDNVAFETCLGDKDYYFNIGKGGSRPFATGVFLLFGRSFDQQYPQGVVTSTHAFSREDYRIRVYPTLIAPLQDLVIRFSLPEAQHLKFQLVDLLGRSVQVQQEQFFQGENSSRMTLAQHARGHYFLVVRDQNGRVLASEPVLLQ
jgi:unsaturated rhamnogalacturonyl hydrolase